MIIHRCKLRDQGAMGDGVSGSVGAERGEAGVESVGR
jgi:hypothetical protein